MNIRQIDALIEIAARLQGGISRIIQPQLCDRVAGLEQAIDCRLCLWDGRAIIGINSAGMQFLADARRLRDRIALAEQEAQRIAAGISGRVRLGVCEEIITRRLGELLACLRVQLPDVEIDLVELSSAAIATSVRKRESDLGFVIAPIRGAGLEQEALITEHWMAIFPPGHPLGAREWITPHDLADMPLVLTGEQYQGDGHLAIRSAFDRAGVPMTVGCQMLSRSAMLSLVAAGAGVTFVPSSFHATVNGVDVRGPYLKGQPLTIAGIYNSIDPSGLAMQVLRMFKTLLAGEGEA